MAFVTRDEFGNIVGIFNVPQEGIPEEEVEDPVLYQRPVDDLDTLNAALMQDGGVVRALGQALFTLVNEVRVLKSQTPLTLTQFKNYLKGLMRS
jgi:hypothetical protein